MIFNLPNLTMGVRKVSYLFIRGLPGFTGYKMFKKSAADMHPEQNPLVNWFIKRGKVTNEYHGKKFFVTIDSKRLATPLFLCLLSIEFTD